MATQVQLSNLQCYVCDEMTVHVMTQKDDDESRPNSEVDEGLGYGENDYSYVRKIQMHR